MRNPLSTIQMNLELLAEDLEEATDPQTRPDAPQARNDAARVYAARGILNAFLQFARAGEMERTPTSLNRVVSEFIDFYRPEAQASGIEVSPHLAADLPDVALDETLIRQVLSNLIRNSQQAMPDGGQIEVQTSLVNNQAVLSVIDTGKGMDERARKKAFEPFFSTSPMAAAWACDRQTDRRGPRRDNHTRKRSRPRHKVHNDVSRRWVNRLVVTVILAK